MNPARLAQQLELHEGVALKLYKDTLGNDTLGVGYNVTSRTLHEFERTLKRPIDVTKAPCITVAEARQQLTADILRVEKAVKLALPEYDTLNEPRQHVVVDMAFNLGFRALTFKAAIAALRRKDWSTVAKEIHKSKWAYQVDDGPGGRFGRADRLAQMMLTGVDYTV